MTFNKNFRNFLKHLVTNTIIIQSGVHLSLSLSLYLYLFEDIFDILNHVDSA